jgi:bifunctional enzyme CysN/CysC
MVTSDVTALVNQPIVRVVVCGSVDDGKSTLIGRLLAETASVPDDLLDQARKIRRGGSMVPYGEIDFSLLTDGLEAERTQGITIDVAYRHLYLPSGQRAIIADAPGHEQYTRNMAVAASTADLAILLVDPIKGIRPQTHRHLTVCALMGVQAVIVAVNKMDLVRYSEDRFERLSCDVRRAAAHLGIDHLTMIPVSALVGDNVVTASEATTWYGGPTLLDALSQWEPAALVGESVAVRLPVQYVVRVDECRVYTGTLVAGTLRVGNKVMVARSGVVAGISRLLVTGCDAAEAIPGSAIAVELDRDCDIARGDLLIEPPRPGEPALPATAFSADLVWTGDQALVCGRSYLLVAGALTVPAVVITVCGRRELTSGKELPARSLEINDIGVVEVATDTAVPLEEYRRCREGGGFILVDRTLMPTGSIGQLAPA